MSVELLATIDALRRENEMLRVERDAQNQAKQNARQARTRTSGRWSVAKQADKLRKDIAAIRAFAAEMQASTGDDLGPMIWRDVQRLADGYERAVDALEDVLAARDEDDAYFAREKARSVLAETRLADEEGAGDGDR